MVAAPRTLVSDVVRCHLPFNLQAVEPIGRPYNCFDVGSSVRITPSGLVSGGVVDARVLKLKFVIDGEGPDQVLPSCFEVMCVKLEDYVVSSVFFGVFLASCKPAAED
jgi:hypothetical protein